jgi:hypothetical protein
VTAMRPQFEERKKEGDFHSAVSYG